MNVIPLNADVKIDEKKESGNKNITVVLPVNWWYPTASIDAVSKQARKTRIYHLTRERKPKFNYGRGWSISKGDYRIKNVSPKHKDFVYYRNLKLKVLKYSIYPVIVVTAIIILQVSRLLANL